MKNHIVKVSIFILLLQSFSCNDISNFDNNIYKNDDLEILDEEETLSKIKEIAVIKNNAGYDDIIIHSFNGSEASFYSNNPCGGPGPAYSVIASIPKLGIIFLDRTYTCDFGGKTIIVSLKDGIYRELKSSIWNIYQLSISPNGSWLVISNSDCSVEYDCNIEILSLKNSHNSLLDTKFYNNRVCANKDLNWFSDNGFNAQTAIGEKDSECIYKSIQFNFTNNEWTFNFE